MVEDVRKDIEKLILKHSEELRRSNAVGVAALFTDDAILLPSGSEMIRGRQGIEKFYRENTQGVENEEVITIMELSGSGDTINIVGNLTVRITKEGQVTFSAKGKIVGIMKHTAPGWRIHTAIWNWNK
jgi:ketosteroid isomerase-like protein